MCEQWHLPGLHGPSVLRLSRTLLRGILPVSTRCAMTVVVVDGVTVSLSAEVEVILLQ